MLNNTIMYREFKRAKYSVAIHNGNAQPLAHIGSCEAKNERESVREKTKQCNSLLPVLCECQL